MARRADHACDGQRPTVGVSEGTTDAANISSVIGSEQVLGYLVRYGQVLVTNYRQFVLMVRDRNGNARKADEFSLADTDEQFWISAAHPRSMAERQGDRFVEFLTRVVRNRATLTEPKDVAWFLASHARAALERVGRQELPALLPIRTALAEAPGITFPGETGEHFCPPSPLPPQAPRCPTPGVTARCWPTTRPPPSPRSRPGSRTFGGAWHVLGASRRGRRQPTPFSSDAEDGWTP